MAKRATKKQSPPTQEEIDKREIEELTEKHRFIASKPTRTFEVGENVIFGSHDNTEILVPYDNGNFYKIRCYGQKPHYGSVVNYSKIYFTSWFNIHKKGSFSTKESFIHNDIIYFDVSKSEISSLLHMAYDRMDFNPPYQRELVWNNTDKEYLLDSIFQGVDIGKFAFMDFDYQKKGFDFRNDYFRQIIDGKQRLTTILEFYEDRYSYKGKKFSEISFRDKCYFLQKTVDVVYLKEPDDPKMILKYFLLLNTAGRVVAREHLDKIRGML